jgi:hypothetical protein
VPEMESDQNPLRIVIQQLGISRTPGYRVIVYGDDFKPRHCDFGSAAVLLEALGAAVPVRRTSAASSSILWSLISRRSRPRQ